MAQNAREYYRRRASEERVAAAEATSEAASEIHANIAAQYEIMARKGTRRRVLTTQFDAK